MSNISPKFDLNLEIFHSGRRVRFDDLYFIWKLNLWIYAIYAITTNKNKSRKSNFELPKSMVEQFQCQWFDRVFVDTPLRPGRPPWLKTTSSWWPWAFAPGWAARFGGPVGMFGSKWNNDKNNQDSEVPLLREDTVLVKSFMGSKFVENWDLLWVLCKLDSFFWMFHIISMRKLWISRKNIVSCSVTVADVAMKQRNH